MLNLTITEKEILDTPNDSDLGALLRERYWAERAEEDKPDFSTDKINYEHI